MSRTRAIVLLAAAMFAAAMFAAAPLAAQQSATLRQAVAAYDDLDPSRAIKLAQKALGEKLSASDRARALELLGFAYSALDSVRPATAAYRDLLLLDPDRDLDPGRISPKITSVFSLSLGQVLVVRKVSVDSARFVVGAGELPIRFTVTRPARVRTRIAGMGREVTVDSSVITGTVTVDWKGLMGDGRPPASGAYRLIVSAGTGADVYERALPLRITAAPVDTLAHLTSLPGYALLPEMTEPPRTWKPFGIAALVTAGVAGTAIALQNSKLGSAPQTPVVVAGGVALLFGGLAVAQKPAPVPNTANIRYNNLVKEQLAKRNAEIAQENVRRRTEVQITIAPDTAAGGAR